MTIETTPFSQEQVSNMMHFNRALTDVKELEEIGDNAIEFKRIAFDHYFTATRTLTPDGFVRDEKMIEIGKEVILEHATPTYLINMNPDVSGDQFIVAK